MLVTELKKALKQRINQSDWLDNATRTRAVDKVNHINDFLAYPDFVKNDTFLDQIYASVSNSLWLMRPTRLSMQP